MQNLERQLAIKYERSATPRVPFSLHRIWVTDSKRPIEMIDLNFNYRGRTWMRNDTVITNEVLSKSGENWKFYFWVLDKKAMPESVLFMESLGYEVRELKELSSFPKF